MKSPFHLTMADFLSFYRKEKDTEIGGSEESKKGRIGGVKCYKLPIEGGVKGGEEKNKSIDIMTLSWRGRECSLESVQ